MKRMLMTEARTASTRTVERALDLLAEVCDQDAISLSECARRADLSPSTALRLLRTLENTNFVARDEKGFYSAGSRLIQLGASALGRQSLAALAEPMLRRIVDATGESAYVSVPGPGETGIYIGMVEGTHSVRHTSWVGRTVSLTGSAIGVALSGEVDGYFVQRSAVEPDVTAIAAPIRRLGGIAGALSLVGPTYRLDDEKIVTFGRIVSREAEILSEQFGVKHDQV
jgi:urocanate hydratase